MESEEEAWKVTFIASKIVGSLDLCWQMRCFFSESRSTGLVLECSRVP